MNKKELELEEQVQSLKRFIKDNNKDFELIFKKAIKEIEMEHLFFGAVLTEDAQEEFNDYLDKLPIPNCDAKSKEDQILELLQEIKQEVTNLRYENKKKV